jgi:hypothetical protein
MSHDRHFLERTVDLSRNLPLPALERAMLLYNDPQLLRFVFAQARLPEGLEDIAIALTDEEQPPHLVVHRSGHFRSILGAGMAVTDARILTRQKFDGLVERMEALRERLAVSEKLSGERGGAAKLINRLRVGGNCLSQEEFVAISHWQPLLRDYFVVLFGELADKQDYRRRLLRRCSPKRLERTAEALLLSYWQGHFLLGHLALLSVMDRHRLAAPMPVETDKLFDYFVRTLFCQGSIGLALKAGWVCGELGKDILGAAKRLYCTKGGKWELVEGGMALIGIACRRSAAFAEVVKASDMPLRGASPEDRPLVEQIVDITRRVLAMIEKPDPAEVEAWIGCANQAFQDWHQLSTEHVLPAELRVAAVAHSMIGLKHHAGLGLLMFSLPRVAKAEPKQLYFPESLLRTVRPTWEPSESLALLAMQEGLLEKPKPVRAAPTLGRNDPCSCGSGKKYKRCCAAQPEASASGDLQ